MTALANDELRQAQIEPDYLELVDGDTLAPVSSIDGDVLAVVAARVGTTRLIDNERLSTAIQSARPNSNLTNGRPTT